MSRGQTPFKFLTKAIQELLQQKGTLAISSVVFILLLVTSFSIQSSMREAARRDMEKSLTTVAETTQQALVSWFEEERAVVRILADSEELRLHTRELLKVDLSSAELQGSDALRKLRLLFAPVLTTKRYEGFFVVTHDGINIASARNRNLGWVNLLAGQGDFLNRVIGGDTLMSLPLRSDVPIEDDKGRLKEGSPTMFIGTPIRDTDSSVLAVLLFRIGPQSHFNPILQRGRIGTTGETYAFDRVGKMVSESRFMPHLYETGLLPREASDNLDIELRDPGVNLVNGETSEFERADQSLTVMAQSATRGESGQNLAGYRDYRGVPVVGSWLWIDELDIGITTEIDVDEGYEALWSNLTVIRTATIVVMGLFISILMISSISRARLIASDKRYRSLFSNANDAILIADPVSRRILDGNDRALRQLLYSRAELLDLKILDLHPTATIDQVLTMLDRLEVESGVIFETKFQRKDGSIYDAELSARMVELEDKMVVQAFVRDVTQRKILEEKLVHSQRMETIGTLAGGIAHDFNNLLTPIIGNGQLIAANVDSGNNVQIFANRIVGAGQRAAALVSQLMTLGQKSESNMAAVELSEIVNDAIRLVSTSIPASISLTTDIDKSSTVITADAGQIHQVIMNLCINAIHAMEDVGGELRVALHSVEADDTFAQMVEDMKEGSYAKISISDAGHGMDETVRRQIFDPFFSTKEQGKGTGLGLSTAHSIVTSHGGHITVYSEPEIGATFNIYLPVSNVSATVAHTQPEGAIVGGVDHILVVDDDVENTRMMSDMLTQLGYTITTSNSGDDAEQEFSDSRDDFDLVITDFAMPGMNGDVLSQRLREVRKEIPIVIMTGFEASLSQDTIRDLNIGKLLHKPFTREEVDRAIHEALSRHQ